LAALQFKYWAGDMLHDVLGPRYARIFSVRPAGRTYLEQVVTPLLKR
jgi:hypothetical protein